MSKLEIAIGEKAFSFTDWQDWLNNAQEMLVTISLTHMLILCAIFAIFLLSATRVYATSEDGMRYGSSRNASLTTIHLPVKGESWLPTSLNQTSAFSDSPRQEAKLLPTWNYPSHPITTLSKLSFRTRPLSLSISNPASKSLPSLSVGSLENITRSNDGDQFTASKTEPAERRVLFFDSRHGREDNENVFLHQKRMKKPPIFKVIQALFAVLLALWGSHVAARFGPEVGDAFDRWVAVAFVLWGIVLAIYSNTGKRIAAKVKYAYRKNSNMAPAAVFVVFGCVGLLCWYGINKTFDFIPVSRAVHPTPTPDNTAKSTLTPPLTNERPSPSPVTARRRNVPQEIASSGITRMGSGPEAYKDISHEQLGQWIIDEADKLSQMANSPKYDDQMLSAEMRIMMFDRDFRDCCAEDVKELRTEAMRRLGPAQKDNSELRVWQSLFPELIYPIDPTQRHRISSSVAGNYAPYLRKIGINLKRKAAPRPAPSVLPFSEKELPPTDKAAYVRLLTVTPTKQLSGGYVVVHWEGNVFGMSTDWDAGYMTYGNDISNPDLAEMIKTSRMTTYEVKVISSNPLTPSKPMHIQLQAMVPFRILWVKFFDE